MYDHRPDEIIRPVVIGSLERLGYDLGTSNPIPL